ncbi:MAG: sulfite reductase (NADPH) flavoprotein alpha-component [Chlamydiales bacterium]|jgi:sulfite reductase (NADPH) flavoprotein alpha-component
MNAQAEKYPFIDAKLKTRYLLNSPDSEKHTYHLVLDITDLNLNYKVGDSIRVMPLNDPEIVDKIILLLAATEDQVVAYKRSPSPIALRSLLLKNVDISTLPYKLVKEVLSRSGVEEEHLEKKAKVIMKEMELWDFFQTYSNPNLSVDEICNFLKPIHARFYSIASAMQFVGQEVHLTVTNAIYQKGQHDRSGVATHYLCDLLALGEAVSVSMFPTKDFTLPQKTDIPIIMIGAGTGVAPFYGFMQERGCLSFSTENWLFFGERSRKKDFFYEDFFQGLVQEKKLRLTLAFSRDQEEKVYVQHKLFEYADEVWKWIERGAILYLCGDAKNMAKDVDLTLQKIVQEQGHLSQEEAKDFIKHLKKEKRYLREVY